ncbi:MAG: RNA polymerase factor sigma-54 [Deltaproteobacteria bacterium]|nr:RNA polymerase factor sigma-54 [Deltaproteobacteria bacterium]
MALEIKQLAKLSQQLVMTPQLQQAIKLLQLNRLELMESINLEIETNPLLEAEAVGDEPAESPTEPTVIEGSEEPLLPEKATAVEAPDVADERKAADDIDWENYLEEYNTSQTVGSHSEEKDLPSYENILTQKTSLEEHLNWQLLTAGLNDSEESVAGLIIGNLDGDGYLMTSLDELAAQTGTTSEFAESVLHKIQEFDPIGVAARNLQECLLIQMNALGAGDSLAAKIIANHLKELEVKHYQAIAKKLNVTIEAVVKSLEFITSLDPKPGRIYNRDEAQYISPDVYVYKVGNDYTIVLNEDGLPKLKVNSYYRDALYKNENVSDKTREYIQEKLRSAIWLIRSLNQRQRTIYKVAESIVKFQRDFLDYGVTQLKPMVLRDVAEDVEMHESTISRVTSNKYVHTPQGIFELKYFFNSSINRVEGGAVSAESVKDKIRHLIRGEDKKKPLSDEDIVKILVSQDINIARRTVAKYRESMGFLSSSKRKAPYTGANSY